MSPISITAKNFDDEVAACPQPVLLDFWAAWCGPCKMQTPIIEKLCETRTDIKVGTVNVDEQFELAVRYNVMSIPTLMVFQAGKAVRRAVGLQEEADIEALLEGLSPQE